MSDANASATGSARGTLAGGAPASPFGAMMVPGRFGSPTRAAGVFLVPLVVGRVETVTARPGRASELVRVLSERLGLVIADRPGVWVTPRRRIVSIAPGRFLAFGFDALDGTALDPVAYRVSQGGGIAALRLAGPALRSVLAKGLAIDLHPAAFPEGAAAATALEHIPVTLLRLPDVAGYPLFELLVGRSQARALARWVMEAGAAHGVEIGRPETDLSVGAGFFASSRYDA